MKRNYFIAVMAGVVLGGLSLTARAQSTNEAALIQILESKTATPKDKADACAELKRTGTKNCVKALAPLLTDPELAQSARYVLETLPGPQAGKALLEALPKTLGGLQTGIIFSLGLRGDMDAVPKFGKLLSSTNEEVAVAAAEGLGKLGGTKALGLLQSAAVKSSGPIHAAEIDGILACANTMLETNQQKTALKAFQTIYSSEKVEDIRIAAFRGVLLASGKGGLSKMTDAILSGDGASRSAALLVAPQWKGTEATTALAALLAKATVPVRLALIQCLEQRDDPAAAPALVKQLDNPDETVQIEALTAVGMVGDDSTVNELVARTLSGSSKKRAAAHQALLTLHRGPVTAKMLEKLKADNAQMDKIGSPKPDVGLELLRALGERGDKAAVPVLLEVARNANVFHDGALQALGLLAENAQIPELVKLVADAPSDELRAPAVDALSAAFDHLQSAGVKLDVTAFIAAVGTGSPDTRLALLPVCSGVSQESVRTALQTAMADANPKIRNAAVHAMCDTHDVELLPELLKLAGDTNQPASRLLAVRACVRLATQDENVKLANDKKLDVLTALQAMPLDIQEKKVVLSGLGNVADRKSLVLTIKMLDDAEVKAEAEQAVVRLAGSLTVKNPRISGDALKRVAAETTDPATKKAAEDALKKIK